MDSITIRKPDDWHTHLRDSHMMEAVLPFTTARFKRAIVMPNLMPEPVTTVEAARSYRERIIAESSGTDFEPLMTLYMTDETAPEELKRAFLNRAAYAVKLYPANATTNSSRGVTDIEKVYGALGVMQEIGMPLLLHGETVMRDGRNVNPVDREKVFIDTTLTKLVKDFPSLKISLEHATTKDAVQFVSERDPKLLASTITIHHLAESSEDVAESETPQYLHCMPVIKSPENRQELRNAATSGDSHFFLGTDSAPHPMSAKEREHPAAGIFTAPAAVELYAQVFEEEGKLDNLEKFASLNGPAFYELPPNEERISLVKKPWTLNDLIDVEGGEKIRPFGFDTDPSKRLQINWKLHAP